jgi:hypothetical protein
VSFPAGGPGVIVMAIQGRDERAVVVFNATPSATEQTIPSLAGARFRLHPVQASGGDPIVKQSTYQAGTFSVPARTVAVFVG